MSTCTINSALDLPVPDRTTQITRPAAAMEAKTNFKLGIIAAVFGVAAALAFWAGHSVAAFICGGLAAGLFISIFTKRSDVGQCPFCLVNFTATPALVKSGLVRCDACGKYSEIANKVVKPMDPST